MPPNIHTHPPIKGGTKKHVPCNIQNCNKQKMSCRAKRNCRAPHRHATASAFAGNTLKHVTIHHWLLRLSEYNTPSIRTRTLDGWRCYRKSRLDTTPPPATNCPLQNTISMAPKDKKHVQYAIGVQTQPSHGRAPSCRQNMGRTNDNLHDCCYCCCRRYWYLSHLNQPEPTTHEGNLQTHPTSAFPTPR